MSVALSLTIVDAVENRTFDELRVGDSASVTQTLAPEQLQLVATLLGDVDPAHVEMWGATLVARLLATKLPGPGSVSRLAQSSVSPSGRAR